jgi:hypothetical protein
VVQNVSVECWIRSDARACASPPPAAAPLLAPATRGTGAAGRGGGAAAAVVLVRGPRARLRGLLAGRRVGGGVRPHPLLLRLLVFLLHLLPAKHIHHLNI